MRDKSILADQQVFEDAYSKSSYSGSGTGSDCLEIAELAGGVRVRDSKNPTGPALNLFTADFQVFIAAAKAGQLAPQA
ncbi:DUF397 domain-containing protein [Streptomyces sp. NPDC052051]|uniref:DUF397 domain-containing protein n=1 Tax=Streptomyces sp. NPDC052051 TaxID=3154649 RepID=UPI0034360C3B